MNKLNILGINISVLNKKEVLEKIEGFLADGRQHQLVTPNPEFLLAAQYDEEFFYILNNADLAIPDGIGLKIASWFLGKNLQRISGADLIKDILRMAEERGLRVGIVNRSGGLSSAEDIKRALKEKYPRLNMEVEGLNKEIKNQKSKIKNFNPDILFCAFGAPEQDEFIFHALKQISSIRLGMGVGGSFDFLTGKTRRAPRFMRFLGLEWLWRLIFQPLKQADDIRRPFIRRVKRIINAVIVFPYKFLKWKFWLPLFYRANIACLIFKKNNNLYKILVVERQNEKNHWQLPQGGTDGENVERAGRREIKEEIGVDKIKNVKVFKNLYKYDVKPPHAEFTSRFRSYGFRGQKNSLLIAEFTGEDSDIKINFWDHSAWKWVDAENLVNEVHPVRREATEIFLKKFYEAQI